MDYSKLSDFDINCEVLEIFSPDIKHMCLSGDNSCFYDCGPTGDGWHQIDIPAPCNNPADAWPIIHQHGISIAFDKDEDEWLAWGDFAFDQAGWDMKKEPEISCAHTNPLRAAMTVFLMMQESANVQANPARPDIR